MKKYSHVALGLFIAEQFKKAGVKIAPMCAEIGLGKAYKRGDVRLSHFTRLLAYFYDCHTKEEFRTKAIEWVDRYIDYREKHG